MNTNIFHIDKSCPYYGIHLSPCFSVIHKCRRNHYKVTGKGDIKKIKRDS